MQLLGPVARQATRHRPLQALALALLAFVVTALSTLAPLYSADMANAIIQRDVTNASPLTTALQITSKPVMDPSSGEYRNADNPATLAKIPPSSMRALYATPTLRRYAHADIAALQLTGQVVWVPGECEHVRVVAGRCPRGRREIMVSRADLRLHGIRLDRRVEIAGVTRQDGRPAGIEVHIVGVYRPRPGSFWQLDDPVGKSGSPGSTGTGHDDWLTARDTFLDAKNPLPSSTSSAIFPLDPAALDVDTFLRLRDRIRALSARVNHQALGARSVASDVGTLSDDVRGQRAQASRTVPLLMLQVVLLALVVFWQVLAAAADQRRPDVALSRLRGRSRRATTGSLLRELLPVVEAGVLAGGLGGIAASLAARAVLLPSASFTLPWSFWAAFAAAAAVIAGLTYLTARSLAREPVDRLLRQVPARHRWKWTAFDTVLITIAVAGTLAFATGGLGRDFALAGPALVALLAGLLLGHVITPLAASIGHRALRRGRLVPALAALDAARRPGARRTVTLVTLAAAFLVFFANAWAVGAGNRQSVAEQVTGAPAVLTLNTSSITPVRAALHDADPHGTKATPVVLVRPLGNSTAPSTMALDPTGFPKIAFLTNTARNLPWHDLTPTAGPPIRVKGGALTLTADTHDLPRAAGRVDVELELLKHDGSSKVSVKIGTLRHGGTTRLHSTLPCSAGCTVLSLTLGSTPGRDWAGRIRLGPIQADTATAWNHTNTWHNWTGDSGSHLTATPDGTDGLLLDISTGGTSTLTLTSTWLPATMPVFTLGMHQPPGEGKGVLLGLDRHLHTVHVISRAPRMPEAPAHTLVADLDPLARAASVDPGDQVQVWLGSADNALRTKVTHALQHHGVDVTDTATVDDQHQTYDESVAAWSLSLALLVGAITLLITLLAMIVLAITGWRATARDLAALQLNGINHHRLRHASTLAQTLTITTAVLTGTAAGILASWLAIDQIPLFAHQPPLTSLDLAPSWTTIAVTTAVVLVVLLAVAALLVRRVAARAGFERLRETA